MRTTVHLPDDLLRRAKQKAAADGRTLTSLIEEGLRIVVAEKPSTRSDARRLPRVSTATGGLMPGLDPVKFATQLQETDDIENMERLRKLWADS
ncbi:MAG: DUF2191 domain-containing protein [Sphingomonadales bacterium]|nr:DUF2191 domain-containing protein [Sphingomonadales bacterium]